MIAHTMKAETNLWFFEEANFVNIFCPQKIVELDHPIEQGTYQKGEHVYAVGEPAEYIYIIREGRVKIGMYSEEGKEIVKTILTPGEVFGEMALTGEENHRDFAVALDNGTMVCAMTLDDMRTRMADNQDLSLNIFKMVGKRIQKLERRIELLISKDARTRVIEFLRDMAHEKGRKVGFETMIPNHLKHQDIASLTGTSRQTVTTILNELKDKNIINFDRRKILIRDLALLK
ncbi:MAG: Crp/Fnr family transcriptional regulator [Cyclobacteriaceae bacterium]